MKHKFVLRSPSRQFLSVRLGGVCHWEKSPLLVEGYDSREEASNACKALAIPGLTVCEIDGETGAQVGFVKHLGMARTASYNACGWQLVGPDGVAVALIDFEDKECTRTGYAPRYEGEALAFFAEIADIEKPSNRHQIGKIAIPA
jgi:hypothetical protein